MNLRLAALYGRDPGILRRPPPSCCPCAVYIRRRGRPRPACSPSKTAAASKAGDTPAVATVGSSAADACSCSVDSSAPRVAWCTAGGARGCETCRVAAFLVLWAITWIFPVTFMIMMAWGCESHSRQLFQSTRAFYASEEAPTASPPEPGRGWRERACRAEGRRSARPVSRSRSRFRPASSRTRFTSTRSSGSPGCRPLACSSPSPS